MQGAVADRTFERTWSIALFGAFNPMIFLPEWLSEQAVVDVRVADGAVVDYEGSAGVSITADSFTLEVTLERLLLQTSDQDQSQDLATFLERLFEVLQHTPITSAACGFDVEWDPGGAEQRDELLERFVNSGAWAETVGHVIARSVTIEVPPLGPGSTGYVTLEDSAIAPHGVYLSLVTECEPTPPPRPSEGAAPIVGAVSELWSEFVEKAESVASLVVGTRR